MKLLTLLISLIITGSIANAQYSLNPAPSGGEIVLTASNTYIYLTNTTAAAFVPSISVASNSNGISLSLNRCTTSLKVNQSCYVIVSFPNYATNSQTISVALNNASSPITNLKFNPTVVAPQVSNFSVSSMSLNNFNSAIFVVQNKTSSTKSYSPVISGTDASKYSITLNRCNSIPANGTCQVYVKLAPQVEGSYSALISEPQVTGSISLSSTITNATVGVIIPPNPSISIVESSLSFGTITQLGQTASKIVTISNNGNVALSPIVSVSGTGLMISLNRCLSLISPNQSCTVALTFKATTSMSNGPQSGLSFSAKATSTSSELSIPVSATLNINPVLLSSSGGSSGGSLATPLLINSAGGNMFHYSTVNNKLYSWGANSYYGLVGDGTTNDRGDAYSLLDSPPLVGKSLKDFSFFDDHACLLTTDNNIYCWGYNYAGGAGPVIDGYPILVPTLMPKGDMGSKTIKKLSIGAYFSVALSEDGHVYVWGANGAGQSGSIDGQSPSPSDIPYCGSPYGNLDCQTVVVPKEIDMSGALAGEVFKDVTATYSNVCGITTTNRVFCWGSNFGGAVGDGTNTDAKTPKEIVMNGALAGKTIKKLYMAYGPSCVLTTEDLLYCWGDNYFGQLGTGSLDTSGNSPQPVVMSGTLAGKTVKEYYPGYGTACMIASDDLAYCWGWGSFGQVGNNSDQGSNIPVPVDTSGVLAGKTIKKMSLPYFSGNTVCAIASDDKLYCWGSNQAGQLGDGTLIDSLIPVAVDPSGVLSTKSVVDVASHGGSACVLANDNKVYCIGANYTGQLGNGNANIGNSSSVFVLAPTIP